MSYVNKTGKPSILSLIRKLISNKIPNKTNLALIIIPINAPNTQSTLPSHTNNISITTTSTTTSRTSTSISSSPSPSATFSTSDINNAETHINHTVQNTITNYSQATANDNSPSIEQALVFNSIELYLKETLFSP
ncbi:unnamed protein product [Macrosiphum euphorbiae]|uniref:Uncharacterized protein n=1 Tax=Macrosiphum euphorbiae TaxID=13131 RepID=A0AAV0W927_9HEMI|nr:unnamed protein product [Macrosiphum euphorbiae]